MLAHAEICRVGELQSDRVRELKSWCSRVSQRGENAGRVASSATANECGGARRQAERSHLQGFLPAGQHRQIPPCGDPAEQDLRYRPQVSRPDMTGRRDLSYKTYCGGRVLPLLGLRGGSSGSSGGATAFPLNAERSTSLAKKNFPSDGTMIICNLSESRSAIIF